MITTVIPEISEVDLDDSISCEVLLQEEDLKLCRREAEARISYACSRERCPARSAVVFICNPCLSYFPGYASARCPFHGMVTPVLTRIL